MRGSNVKYLNIILSQVRKAIFSLRKKLKGYRKRMNGLHHVILAKRTDLWKVKLNVLEKRVMPRIG